MTCVLKGGLYISAGKRQQENASNENTLRKTLKRFTRFISLTNSNSVKKGEAAHAPEPSGSRVPRISSPYSWRECEAKKRGPEIKVEPRSARHRVYFLFVDIDLRHVYMHDRCPFIDSHAT